MSIRNKIKQKLNRQAARRNRVRAEMSGTGLKPRMSVFRSNKHITVQLIDDKKGVTLAVCSDIKPVNKETAIAGGLKGKCAVAFAVGIEIAKKAIELKAVKVVFDRGSYRYHGRVKSLAEGARKGGLNF